MVGFEEALPPEVTIKTIISTNKRMNPSITPPIIKYFFKLVNLFKLNFSFAIIPSLFKSP